MELLRSHAKACALDQDRIVLVHVEARDEDFADTDIEAALQEFSVGSVATVRTARDELTLVFCCIANAIAFTLECLASGVGPSIRLGVHAQAVDRNSRSQSWDLQSVRRLAGEATFGGVAMCRDSYAAASEFFEDGGWFLAVYEDACEQGTLAVASRMPMPGPGAFSTFAGLSPALA